MELQGERTLREWTPTGKAPAGFTVQAVVLGSSTSGAGLEVVVLDAEAGAAMSREALGAYHSSRVGKHTTPVVVAATRDGQAWLFGPNAQAETLGPLPIRQAERMLQAALDETSGLAARRRLADLYEAARDARPDRDGHTLPGVANAGLFATHEIRYGARLRTDWGQSATDAAPLLGKRRQDLIEALGFAPHREAAHALLLADGATSRAIAVLLDEAEHFDSASSRFHVSPVAYAIALAQRHELPWVLILRGTQLRLYPAKSELGVGRKGLAETYFELDLALVTDDTAGFLPLVFSASALAPGGSTYEILAASAQYAVALGERLRAQVYDQIVPRLSLAVAEQLRMLGKEMDRQGLDLAYQLTLRIFFRLLFQAYAEDRKLLPYGENPRYDRNALNTYARDFVDEPDATFDANSASIWDDLAQVWHVIDKGDSAWSVPAYNGGLFSADPELHPEGALLERMSVTNDVMGPVLRALLLDEADGEVGPIDFRALSVREFGTIYEGLLESSLAMAEVDLVLDDQGMWIPAPDDHGPLDPERAAPAGAVYFHNTSGQRRGTGSYFTPSFVVEHLLEEALDPTLDEHLTRVEALLEVGDQAGAADLFFDFRVADIAMGSGHFLTAAIDHLEARMAAFLEDHPVPGVTNELRRLEDAARAAAGPDTPEPEPSSLLRRQIARRCIYGLDINPVAVELARVSIWIHTFVRGLPMSSLDHNLVCANSLTGIGTVEEALDALVPGRKGAPTLLDEPIETALRSAREVLLDAGALSEIDRKETQAASRAVLAAREAAQGASLLFDAAVLTRAGDEEITGAADPTALMTLASRPMARESIAALRPAHLPALFPEVLLRDDGGFDVLIGNPPWEELMVDEPRFWARYRPGLMGRKVQERTGIIMALREEHPELLRELEDERATMRTVRGVLQSAFPLGKGDVDLYKAFAWRMWRVVRPMGRVGIVLPKTAFSAAGLEKWRRTILAEGNMASVVTLVNRGQWVFADVHPQYTIAAAVLDRRDGDEITLGGPFASRAEFDNYRRSLVTLRKDTVLTLTSAASIPTLTGQDAADVLTVMRRAPRLDEFLGGAFRPVSEFHATNDRDVFDRGSAGDIPVWSGASFDTWNPDSGDAFAYAVASEIESTLLERFANQRKLKRSAFWGMDLDADLGGRLPFRRPRIAFRGITNPTNARTVISVLAPPDTALTNIAPYFLVTPGHERAEAFLLGVMNSIVFDWYARRFVETQMNFHFVSAFPVPVMVGDMADEVAVMAARLSAPDERFAAWAKANGVGVGSIGSESEREDLITRLDAYVARLYGVTREQLEFVFSSFHRGWDYAPRLNAVLEHFDAIKVGP